MTRKRGAPIPTLRLLPTILPASSVIGLTWIRIGAFAAQRNEIVLRISGPRPPSANPFGSATRLHSEPSDLALNDAEARTLLSPLVTTTRRFGSNEIEKLDVEQCAEAAEARSRQEETRREERQPRPGLAARDVAGLDDQSEGERDRKPDEERHERRKEDLRPDELAEPDEPPREPPDHVLVALGREGACREHEGQERDRERERVGLHLGRERPRPPALGRLDELDRIRRRPQRVVCLRKREPGVADEPPDPVEVRVGRQLPELLLRPVEPEDLELAAEEAAVAAVEDQPDV